MGGESPLRENRTVVWIFGGCVGGMLFALLGPLYFYYLGDLQTVYLNVNLMEAFGRGTGPIGLFVCGYCLFVGIFVMHAYVLTTLMVHREAVEFNEQLKAIGSKDSSRLGVCNELARFYERQVSLAAVVCQLNNTFEVYAFVMLGTAIPTVIFTIVTFIQRLRHGAYFSAAFISSGFSLCIVELIALTFTPAKIHTASVSLWGFALLSKPLILSVVSLTVTYLVLLVQMGREEGIE
ncbi:hypothetical protein M3Y99_00649800 [Aphelenchoides fujianensis]|nr:hypothetical protein M3Y99_00649800 [Aphelenchoides fujianensis]